MKLCGFSRPHIYLVHIFVHIWTDDREEKIFSHFRHFPVLSKKLGSGPSQKSALFTKMLCNIFRNKSVVDVSNYGPSDESKKKVGKGPFTKDVRPKSRFSDPPSPVCPGLSESLHPPPPSDVRLFDFPWYENH